jgi:hypothetical protein
MNAGFSYVRTLLNTISGAYMREYVETISVAPTVDE